MVTESLWYRKGTVLFSITCDLDKEEDAINKAKTFCKDNGLAPHRVAIRKITENNYKIILVKVK